jgi:hypothetical protein
MGATGITLVDFTNAFAAKTNSLDIPFIHPAGARTIAHWLDYMLSAAEAEQAGEVAKYVQWVSEKVSLEREWSGHP